LRYLDSLQPLALFVLRLVLGVIMIGHGYSKVFGGIHHHVQMVSSLGLPGWLAYLSAAAEFFGGILVILGLLTRCAALAITINLTVAIVKVHWHNGLLGNGGYQFPLALASIAFALIFLGAGPIALEALRGGVGSGRARK
jgi:putative oxidoreductase